MNNTISYIEELAARSPDDLIGQAEQQYHRQIAALARTISDNDDLKIVAIAGPSASGKTTTAHILRQMLTDLGEKTEVVSLDDFYLPGDQLPFLPDGRRDLESVNALDKELICKCLGEIVQTGVTWLPCFSFADRTRRVAARRIDLSGKGIAVVEGLHALNPELTGLVPKKHILTLYISVNSAIRAQNGAKLLSSRQIRLVRRILRDRLFRSTDIEDTLRLWKGVMEGEEKYLYCFKPDADFQVKTLHLYEPCVYRDRFLPLVEKVSPDTPDHAYLIKTAEALKQFPAMSEEGIPAQSLIREFIGGGMYA